MLERHHYQVHGTNVEVRSTDRFALSKVGRILKHFGLVPGVDEVNQAAVILRISGRAGAVRVPSKARPMADSEGIQAWIDEHALYLECAAHICRLQLRAGIGAGVVPPGPSLPRKDFVIYSLLLLLRRRGLYGLHASCVASAGMGCLFVAPSGSGKSTNTYSLVRRGWDYLGDDAVLLRESGEGVEALALRRDLCLDPALARLFPEIAQHGQAGPFAGRGKRRLPMRDLYAGQLIDQCVPRVLVFPEIVPDATSRLVPAEPADALARLMAQSAVLALDSEALPLHLQLLARLARQARSYRLLAGRDLRENPEAVASLLAEVHAGSSSLESVHTA